MTSNSNPQRLSSEEWADWRNHPATKTFFNELELLRDEGFIEVLLGDTENLISHGIRLGKVNGLTSVINSYWKGE